MGGTSFSYEAEFLLPNGGPAYQVQQRLGLIRRESPLIVRRALLSVVLTWLPMLILSLMEGRAFGHSVHVPFLRDYSTYGRYLIAMPVLILAEAWIGPRVAEAVRHFKESGVVPEHDFPVFDAAIQRGMRLRDSLVVELLLLVLAYLTADATIHTFSSGYSSWQLTAPGWEHPFTWAGRWNALISFPLYHFLLYRWLWRLLIWYGFLRRVSRLDLRLTPSHPDRSGGIGFIGEVQLRFGIVFFALGAAASGVLANEILDWRLSLTMVLIQVSSLLALILLVGVAPLMMFTPQLFRVKRWGRHEYGTLSTAITEIFQRKWIEGDNPQNEPILSSRDLQSLAGLGTSYELVDRMRIVPFGPELPILLILAVLIPIIPSLLTVIPLKEILLLAGRLLVG